MKFKDNLFKHSRDSRSLKCVDCSLSSTAVYRSNKYDTNLCVPCLMLRIKQDLNQD